MRPSKGPGHWVLRKSKRQWLEENEEPEWEGGEILWLEEIRSICCHRSHESTLKNSAEN